MLKHNAGRGLRCARVVPTVPLLLWVLIPIIAYLEQCDKGQARAGTFTLGGIVTLAEVQNAPARANGIDAAPIPWYTVHGTQSPLVGM